MVVDDDNDDDLRVTVGADDKEEEEEEEVLEKVTCFFASGIVCRSGLGKLTNNNKNMQ